jgi:hypothetical protein
MNEVISSMLRKDLEFTGHTGLILLSFNIFLTVWNFLTWYSGVTGDRNAIFFLPELRTLDYGNKFSNKFFAKNKLDFRRQ